MANEFDQGDDPSAFLTFLAQVQDGRFSDELSARMKSLVTAVTDQARNAGGKPKAQLKIEINFHLADGILEVTADATTKMPKTIRSRSIFYALKDGGVSPNNPKQLSLDIAARDVTSSAAAGVRAVR